MCFAIPALGITAAAMAQASAAAAAVAAVASTAITAVGANQSAKAQNAANKYNASIAEQQALDSERRGAMAEAQKRQESRLRVGSAIAQMGASGTLPSSGSNLDVLAQSAEYGAQGATAARLNAGREAFGYRSQAELDSYYGRAALAQGAGRVAGTALTGTAKILGQTSNYWDAWKPKEEDYWTRSNYGYNN